MLVRRSWVAQHLVNRRTKSPTIRHRLGRQVFLQRSLGQVPRVRYPVLHTQTARRLPARKLCLASTSHQDLAQATLLNRSRHRQSLRLQVQAVSKGARQRSHRYPSPRRYSLWAAGPLWPCCEGSAQGRVRANSFEGYPCLGSSWKSSPDGAGMSDTCSSVAPTWSSPLESSACGTRALGLGFDVERSRVDAGDVPGTRASCCLFAMRSEPARYAPTRRVSAVAPGSATAAIYRVAPVVMVSWNTLPPTIVSTGLISSI